MLKWALLAITFIWLSTQVTPAPQFAFASETPAQQQKYEIEKISNVEPPAVKLTLSRQIVDYVGSMWSRLVDRVKVAFFGKIEPPVSNPQSPPVLVESKPDPAAAQPLAHSFALTEDPKKITAKKAKPGKHGLNVVKTNMRGNKGKQMTHASNDGEVDMNLSPMPDKPPVRKSIAINTQREDYKLEGWDKELEKWLTGGIKEVGIPLRKPAHSASVQQTMTAESDPVQQAVAPAAAPESAQADAPIVPAPMVPITPEDLKLN